MERAPETFILCGTEARELLIEKEKWRVFRCQKCGLGFLDPRPSQGEIGYLYRSEYFSQRYDEGLDLHFLQFRKRLRGENIGFNS